MSKYLLLLYRPVVDALLALHGLSVPESTRDNLATDIMLSREVVAETKGGIHSPLPALRKADTHAKALLKYASQPPSRVSSIANRCAKLYAVLNDPRVAMELAITAPALDQTRLLDGLAALRIEPHQLSRLSDAVAVTERNARASGRPWSAAKLIIRGGCIAWNRGGRTESFTWSAANGSLSGPLPAFLSDLLACCNGTHDLARSLRQPDAGQRKRGDGLHLSDDALRVVITECKNAALF